jgi:hypothetical protein
MKACKAAEVPTLKRREKNVDFMHKKSRKVLEGTPIKLLGNLTLCKNNDSRR